MTFVKAFNPFAPAVSVRHFNNLDRLFTDFFADDFTVKSNVATPSVNVTENEQGYKIAFIAPGFSKENFTINVEKNVLTITADVKTEKTAANTEGVENAPKADKILRTEYAIKSLKRQFTLPENADVTAIKAAYENGILNVHVPKVEKVSVVQTIEIQ